MFLSPINGHHGRVSGHHVREHHQLVRWSCWQRCFVQRQRQQALQSWIERLVG
jgi:hypothetical protein